MLVLKSAAIRSLCSYINRSSGCCTYIRHVAVLAVLVRCLVLVLEIFERVAIERRPTVATFSVRQTVTGVTLRDVMHEMLRAQHTGTQCSKR